MTTFQLNHVSKAYSDGYKAVDDFNLTIQEQEFIVLVGPSGCGKSTTLRMIAGLEEITDGEFIIGDKVMNDIASKDRDIAMVFQNYALYPHMSVYNNMAFGLQLRKEPKAEIDKKVRDAAEILGLTPYLDKKPKSLSGGQRQRVALGRAIVRNAKLFLMDEPLSNLDAKLRVQMRAEIAKLHQRLKTTTVYVTHDQTEAMTMATRLVVMKDGVIQQVGSPKEVYEFPENVFVGGFIGSPAMNFFKGKVIDGHFQIENVKFKLSPEKLQLLEKNNVVGQSVILGVRPEHIFANPEMLVKYPESRAISHVEVAELTGSEYMLYSSLEGQPFVARIQSDVLHNPGAEIELAFDLHHAHFFHPETELRLR